MSLSSQDDTSLQAQGIGAPALEAKQPGHRIERLPGSHLRLVLGATLNLRLLCVNQKYDVKVVGIVKQAKATRMYRGSCGPQRSPYATCLYF